MEKSMKLNQVARSQWVPLLYKRPHDTKTHFRWGPGSDSWEPIWTHLKQIWVLGLNLALDPSLHLGSPNHELFILVQPKMVPCRFRLYLSLFGLGPWSKGCGSNLWLSANRIALFHWTLDLGPSSKVTLNYPEKLTDNLLYTILLLQHFVLRIHQPRVQKFGQHNPRSNIIFYCNPVLCRVASLISGGMSPGVWRL